jgi:hypothetical protein
LSFRSLSVLRVLQHVLCCEVDKKKTLFKLIRKSLFCSQVLLALASLGIAETPSPTAATTTLSISVTPETLPKYEKGKRTSAETSPQNAEYVFSEEAQRTRYVPQQYAKIQSTKPQDLSHVPQKAATEAKSPETTYTVQYVPAQHISHAFDILPNFQTAKYNQILQKTQQRPFKVSAPAQNSIIPQQQYIVPASFHGLTGSNPISAQHYIAAPTTYHPYVPAYTPGHHIFSPTSTYIAPQHSVPAYSLQPVVMMFTLPGGHYLNTAAGQSALLSFLGGAGSLGGASSARSAPSTPYVIPRQQLTYLTPPDAQPNMRQVSGTFYCIDPRS